jgi:glucose-6-phosphate dehydrogenase assembly protein OpcA
MSAMRVTTALALTPALLVYGWWATSRPPFAATTTVAVVGAGVVSMAVGARDRRPALPPLSVRDVALWSVLLGALAAWQLAAYLQQPRSQHPTLSSLANTMLDTHPARTLAFVAWLAGAARLARR